MPTYVKLNPTIKISTSLQTGPDNYGPRQIFCETVHSDIPRRSNCYSDTQLAPLQILCFQPKSDCLNDE